MLEYALATEKWCTHIRNADKPAGLLFSSFELIREIWSDAGGFWYQKPEADHVIAAEQPTQAATANQPQSTAA
ncbi:MAG: hypothetical protein QOG73_3548 [Acetobacteraceae bacterium]|nr:hypothetical protein [Acetobacteraceae bacterium]